MLQSQVQEMSSQQFTSHRQYVKLHYYGRGCTKLCFMGNNIPAQIFSRSSTCDRLFFRLQFEFCFSGDLTGVESLDAIQTCQIPHFHRAMNSVNLERTKLCSPRVRIDKYRGSHTREYNCCSTDISLAKSSETNCSSSSVDHRTIDRTPRV